MIQIRLSSASFSFTVKGRYKNQTGSANIRVMPADQQHVTAPAIKLGEKQTENGDSCAPES
jgi:hypothetical protein